MTAAGERRRSRRPGAICLAGLCAIAWAATAQAVDRYVAPGGSDQAGCTSAGSPCRSIEYALGQVTDGDTVWLANGTYSTGYRESASGCPGGSAHIYLNSARSCPQLGCEIRATNVTDPPAVRLTGSEAGVIVAGASGWTIRGVTTDSEVGIMQCGGSGITYRDMNVEVAESLPPSTSTSLSNLFLDASDVLLDNVAIYAKNKPCDVLLSNRYAIRFDNVSNMTIEDSYVGHISKLAVVNAVDGLTIRRTHFQHWTNHGLQIQQGSRGILIENSIFGGTTKSVDHLGDTCQHGGNEWQQNHLMCQEPGDVLKYRWTFPPTPCTSDQQCFDAGFSDAAHCVGTRWSIGPRTIDVYETHGLTVRNNTFVGHGSTPITMTNNYNGSDCASVSTDGNCDNRDVKFYNNLVYDLGAGTGAAAERYVSWHDETSDHSTTNFRFDGNMYGGGIAEWQCGNGLKDTIAEWKADNCYGDGAPDTNGSYAVPSFVSYGDENYRPASPDAAQVDAGRTGQDADGVAYCPADDFDGNPRTDGACDVGAFELVTGDGADLPTVGNVRRSDVR